MLKITKQIEKLIQSFHINKNILITTFNFDVINSKLDKIIKKMKDSEVQLSETLNGHHHTQNQKRKTMWTQKTTFVTNKKILQLI